MAGKPIFDRIKKESREEEGREKEERVRGGAAHGPRLLALSDSQIILQHIGFAAPGPAIMKRYASFPGEIALDAERVARVSARFAGVVKETKGNLGATVEKGQTLAVLESNESLSPYEIKAPLSGSILEKNIRPGEVVKEEDTAFVVADLSTVWAELHLYPKDAALIRTGNSIAIEGPDGDSGRAAVVYVEPLADAGTRTVLVRAELRNRSHRWRPGTFVKGRIVTDSARVALAVPEEAVQSLDGRPSVFVKTPKGVRPAAVETGLSDGERTEIRSGLSVTDTVAVENAYLIKSEFEKGTFQEDEGDEEEDRERDRD